MSREEDQRIRTSEKAAEEDEVALPGFRFHPTDEELVGFYLRRKVEKKALPVELIKQIDIYKYDPWDLPKSTSTSTSCDEDTELYLFCKRGRKYRNSIRPNRVTGSGFWKATGIDKPVNNTNRQCIGLKKTLVYYRGSAGKGNKTDWMMHEFRLPTAKSNTPGLQEAEVWTICRIFKRNIVSHQKYIADWREIASKRHSVVDGSKACSSLESRSTTISATTTRESYISFGSPDDYDDYKASGMSMMSGNWPSSIPLSMTSSAACIDTNNNDSIADHDLFTHVNWEELTSLVHFALDPPLHL